jgi:hypothetical protein
VPFLLRDRRPPAAPRAVTATRELGTAGAVVVDWSDGREADLAGYRVFRATTPGGPYRLLTRTPIVRSTFRDAGAAPGAAAFYIVRSFDTSANRSGNSAEASVPPVTP